MSTEEKGITFTTPPICIPVCHPSVLQYFWEITCGWGRRDVPQSVLCVAVPTAGLRWPSRNLRPKQEKVTKVLFDLLPQGHVRASRSESRFSAFQLLCSFGPLACEVLRAFLGCTPRGLCNNTPSKKGCDKGSWHCFREASKKGSWKVSCSGV